jgi:hypothetical protein
LLDPGYRSVTEDIADIIISKRVFDIYNNEDLSSEDFATNDLLDKLAKKDIPANRYFEIPAVMFNSAALSTNTLRTMYRQNRGRICCGENGVFLKMGT